MKHFVSVVTEWTNKIFSSYSLAYAMSVFLSWWAVSNLLCASFTFLWWLLIQDRTLVRHPNDTILPLATFRKYLLPWSLLTKNFIFAHIVWEKEELNFYTRTIHRLYPYINSHTMDFLQLKSWFCKFHKTLWAKFLLFYWLQMRVMQTVVHHPSQHV